MTVPFNPSAFSAILMGNESLTIACGDMAIAGGHRIVAVVTDDETVQAWARQQDAPTFEKPEDLAAAGIVADWLLSIANLRMIPRAVLELPAKGTINFHDGPLPRYAGLNTPAWAIINGETSHGVTWNIIERGVDEGDILVQRMVDIAPEETAFSLNSKCYAAGMETFGNVIAQLEAGTVKRTVQDLDARSYFARDQRPANGGMLDFSQPAEVLSALIRGLDFGPYWNPLGTAKMMLGDDVLSVGNIEIASAGTAEAGRILAVTRDSVTIATQTRAVTLSGLSFLDGNAADPTALCAVGDMITPTIFEPVDAKDEAHWRSSLGRADGVALSFSGDTAGAGQDAIPLNVPTGVNAQTLCTAAALVILKSAGQMASVIALAHEPLSALAASWLPLHVAAEDDTSLASVLDDITVQIAQGETRSGMALDLPSRDPDLRRRKQPEIAISLTGEACPATPVTVVLAEDAPRLVFALDRLTPKAAALLAARLEAGFAAVASATTAQDVWRMPQNEMDALDRCNATERTFEPITIHEAFDAQVALTPQAEAIVFEGETLSYAALNARANQVAHRLRDMGATTGTPIGLYCARSIDLMVGALGILKAGGAYVPLDPSYPADRIAHYMSDSAAPLIVTQSALVAELPPHHAQTFILDTDAGLVTAPTDTPVSGATPDDLAYLIYTSGSTGTPKGVMVSHGNVANFFAGMDDRITHDEGAVWLAVTSLSFDISVLELFWTLARGFKVVLAGDESRTLVANGPVVASAGKIDFNLFYWGNDDGVGPRKYELLLEGAKFADAHGFNAVWTPERHFHAFGGPYPNPSVTGAAVAAVTQNIDVRAGSCVAPLHHPARIAEEWAVIDNLTNGRVGLAIASGWQPDDFVLRPQNTPPLNKPAMYETIEQLRNLWRGTPVAFPKADGTFFEVVTQPRPVSEELPIWVTTAGNPATWREAGEIGAHVLTHLLGQSIDEVADKVKIYHKALADAGHDPADFKVTVMLHTYLADSRAEAEEVARGPMKDYLRSAAGLIKQYAWAFPAFKKPAGATNPFDVDLGGLSDEELDAILEFAFQRYFNESGMFGTVEDGLARAEQLKRIGVDEIACLIDYGIATDKVMTGLTPLAEVLARANQHVTLKPDDYSLAAQIVRHDVTHLQSTPSMAQMLVTNEDSRAALAPLRQVMIGGEPLPGALARVLTKATGGTLQNMYGPTETTIWSTTHLIENAVPDTTAIGTPIANTDVFILDGNMRLQPVGTIGELWIGGRGVTQGYWNRPDLTAERFVKNPFGAGRLYRTGDLARFDEVGVLHFAGRADAQVKIRGHRIELGEIEARLAELPGVTQAVVNTVEAHGSLQLVGYVTTERELDQESAQGALAQVLPDIMVPSFIVTLAAMPLTPNKKIDRKALPRPERRKAPRPGAVQAPQRNVQAAIAAIWRGLLGVGEIRAEDNFFALGGHSLLAVQAHRDIKTKLSVDLSITDIFRFPTLEGLARHLDMAKGMTAESMPEPLAEAAALKSETMSKRRAMRAGRSKAGA